MEDKRDWKITIPIGPNEERKFLALRDLVLAARRALFTLKEDINSPHAESILESALKPFKDIT